MKPKKKHSPHHDVRAVGTFVATIKPDKTLCGCFRGIFRPNAKIHFHPRQIFYTEDDNGEKQAFAKLITGHKGCFLPVPLFLLNLNARQKKALNKKYHVPVWSFDKIPVAVHVDFSEDEEISCRDVVLSEEVEFEETEEFAALRIKVG